MGIRGKVGEARLESAHPTPIVSSFPQCSERAS